MSPDAILFDLDDTILTWDVVAEQAWRETCRFSAEKTGLFKSEELLEMVNEARQWYYSDPERHRIGRLDHRRSRKIIASMALKWLGCDADSIADEMVTCYSALREALVGFFPNAEDTLRQLKGKGMKLGLLTNGEAKAQRAKVERFSLMRYFDTCLIEGELGFGKPESRFYQMALDLLAVGPDRTWMVGDDLRYDVAGAQESGIFSVWHDYSRRGLPPGSGVLPDRIVNNISELLTLC